jgi:hypothetical protein
MTSSKHDDDNEAKADDKSQTSRDQTNDERSSSLPVPHHPGGSAVERDRRIKRMVDRVRSQMFHRK